MAASDKINLKSLRQQVYDNFRSQLSQGVLKPGVFLDLDQLAAQLGTSKTPLRDALLQLEAEGFVSIYPRKGVKVNALQLQDIKNIYQVIGLLETTALLAVSKHLGEEEFSRMRSLLREARMLLEGLDLESYFQRILAFHNVFLSQCENAELVRIVKTLKQRFYDWPRKQTRNFEWERAAITERVRLLDFLELPDLHQAAAYLRDVIWGFEAQKKFILQYYFHEAKE